MRYVGYWGMGVVPILVMNGRHKFGLTNRTYPKLGHHDWRTRIPNLCGRAAVECTKCIPFIVGRTLAKEGTYQAKLAKEYD